MPASYLDAYVGNNFYHFHRQPLQRARRSGPLGPSRLYRAVPNTTLYYPPDNSFVGNWSNNGKSAYLSRDGIIDRMQPVFGYFSGGGWAFGQIESGKINGVEYRISPTAYSEYVLATTISPVITLRYYPVIRNETTNEKMFDYTAPYIERQLVVGVDLPFFADLAPADWPAWFHDQEMTRILDDQTMNPTQKSAAWHANNQWLSNTIISYNFDSDYAHIGTLNISTSEKQKMLSLVAYQEAYVRTITGGVLTLLYPPDPYSVAQSRTPILEQLKAEIQIVADARGLDFDEVFDIAEEEYLTNSVPAFAAGWIGEYFGSQLGNYLIGPTDNFGELLGASFLNSVGADVGRFLAAGIASGQPLLGLGEAVEEVAAAFGSEFELRLADAAVGAISSFLTLELGEALGLDGFGAELFSTLSGSVISHVVDAAFQPGANLFQDFITGRIFETPVYTELPGILGSALAAFLGAKLGSLVVAPQTQAGVVLSGLGSAAGSWYFGTQVGAIVGPIGAFVGAFVGFVLGALFGNMFGRRKPRVPTADADVILQLPNATYALGTEQQANNGNLNLVRSMATGARDTLNGIIELVTRGDDRAKVANTWSPTQVYGHTGQQLWVKLGGPQASKTNVNSADEAVDKGVLWALPATQIIGGDLFMKRAIYNQVRHPGQAVSVAVLAGDLQTAEDFAFYVHSRDIIDQAIADPYNSLSPTQRSFYNTHQTFMTRALAKDSIPLAGADLTFYNANKTMVDSIIDDLQLTQFAAAWIVTLQRAAELELYRSAPSDFYGGAKGFVDSLGVTMLGQHVDYESVNFRMEGNDLIVRYAPEGTSPHANLVPDGEVPAQSLVSWWDNGANVPFHEAIETVDGQRTLVVSKSQTYFSDGNGAYAGSLALRNGDRSDGWFSVTAGERVGFAIEAKTLQGATHANAALAFWDANGNFLSHQAWTTAGISSWARLTGVVNAPTGAAFATVEVWVRNSSGATGAQKVALRNTQLHRLPSGASVPAWDEAPYETFLESNFFADAGYTNWAGQNTALNDYANFSSSTSGVTLDDWRQEWTEHYEWFSDGSGGGYWLFMGYIATDITGGDDIFIGGSGNDTLYGRAGHDWLDGGAGADTLHGGADNDVLLGRDGNDILNGDAGDDVLLGGAGNDTLNGGDGDDIIDGGTGTDTANGGNGDDTFIATYSAMSITGGAGSDTISYRTLRVAGTWAQTGFFEPERPGVYFNLNSGLRKGAAANETYSQIENLEGTQFQDFLAGDAAANTLRGLGDDDRLYGYDGNDILEGGAGADELVGGNGWDTASYEHSSWAVWIDMTAGEYLGGDAEGDTFNSIEYITGSKHADTLKGNTGYNVIKGLAGDDWIIATIGGDLYEGGEGFDTLDFADFTASGVTITSTAFSGTGLTGTHTGMEHFVGSNQNDSITGGSGDDWIQGGTGNDTLNGGAGSDTYIFNAGDGSDTITDTKANNNMLLFGEGLTWTNFWFGTSTHLTMTLGGGDQVVVNNNFADPGNNVLKFIDMGGAGAIDISEINWAAGGTNNGETVTGQSWGRDWLAGYGGNDTIRGTTYMGSEQNGNVFMGGLGDDYIVASMGDDQYVFERGHGRDSIYDSGGVDTIIFGPTVAAEDVIYGIDGIDLIIAIRDLNNPEWTALQVWNNNGDAIRVLNGGAAIYTWQGGTSGGGGYYSGPTYTTIEHIIAGGVSIDLMKLDIPWATSYGAGPYYPVVFDLGGDGLDLISVEHSEVVIKGDDPNAPMMRVGWVDGQDGILAIDRNGDGEISRMSEISFRDEVEGAKTDMEGLVAFDSNEDGVLDARDERWGELKLWRDVNQNGVGKGKEVMSLEEAGIVAIELKLSPTGFTTKDGVDNVALNTAVFHWANGKTGTVHDVALASQLAHIEGPISGKWRPEWSAQPKDGDLGRAKAPDGKSDPVLVSARGLEYAPEQNLGFARDDKDDGKADLPPITSKRGTAEDLEKELAARAEGKGSPASAGSVAPIVIDLDGDGVELIAPEDSPVMFDLNQDGWLDQLGWVGPKDGILALDRDGDNRISLLNEISFLGDKPGATTDLEGLAAFDSDGDGALTAADEQWSDFRVWRDANQDGRSSSNELLTLDEAGVTVIGLSAKSGGQTTGAIRTLPYAIELLAEGAGEYRPLPVNGEIAPLSLDTTSLSVDAPSLMRGMLMPDFVEWRESFLGFEIAKVHLDALELPGGGTLATATASASDPGLPNAVLGETTVRFADGRTVTGFDVALGSISGIELAIRASQFDPSSLFTTPDPYAPNPSFSPWAFDADIRRMLMGIGNGDIASIGNTGPDGVPGALQMNGPQDYGFGGEAVSGQPLELASSSDIGTGQYGDMTLEQLAAPVSPATDEVMAEPVGQAADPQLRRWWSQFSYEPLPGSGGRSNALAQLMGLMDASQTIAQDGLLSRGDDRVIPADPDLARNAAQLRDAMAAFGDKRSGADWKRTPDAQDAARQTLVPSLWKRRTTENHERNTAVAF